MLLFSIGVIVTEWLPSHRGEVVQNEYIRSVIAYADLWFVSCCTAYLYR